MSLVQTTLSIYRESATATWGSLQRTAWAVAFLAACWVLIQLVGVQFSMGGGWGTGLVTFLLTAFAAGSYLSMVEVGVIGRRVLQPGDLGKHLGQNIQPVMSVLFTFWIGELILGFTYPAALFVALPVVGLVFNPIPEMIYQDRDLSLGAAVDFMQRNWPEWLGGQALVFVALGALAYVLSGAALLHALEGMFSLGPFMGFARGPIVVAGDGALIPLTLVLAPVYHAAMLFRGHLYTRLRHSNRRLRAWQSRT